MDETEVRNIDWREYLYWLQRVYPNDRGVYKAALPDTLVWRDELFIMSHILKIIFAMRLFRISVVGVSWLKLINFADGEPTGLTNRF